MPLLGHKHTLEAKNRISLANKGRIFSDKTRLLMSISAKKRCTEYYKEKMSLQRKGINNPFYGLKHSIETKKKISIANKGHRHKEETKLLIGSLNKGRKHTEEAKRKISERSQGKNNPMYGIRLSGSKNHMFGKHFSDEVKEKMSRKRVEYFKTHHMPHPNKYLVEELGHGVRSSWEKEVGMILKNNGIPYGYETRRFDLGDCSYTPDFEINPEIYIEVKGWLSQKSRNKMIKLKMIYPNIKLIGIGTGDESVYYNHLSWCDRNKVVNLIKTLYPELENKIKDSIATSHTAGMSAVAQI